MAAASTPVELGADGPEQQRRAGLLLWAALHGIITLLPAALVDLLCTGERFAARIVEAGILRTSASLLDLMPIVIGECLPDHVHAKLVARIAREPTEYGPATEHPDPPVYAADGCCRGPIWAPSTPLIDDGQRR